MAEPTPPGSAADQDVDEQNATCARCGKPIKRYGSDGIWFTDRYDCTDGGLHQPDPTTHCPGCGAHDPMGDEDAWHKEGCPVTTAPIIAEALRDASVDIHLILDGQEVPAERLSGTSIKLGEALRAIGSSGAEALRAEGLLDG